MRVGSRSRAFTLIELLVVISIIAILAAILFPVFARARENARRASCMSNLKQIGLGFMQYTQDYDEKFPLALWQTGGTFGSNVSSDISNFKGPSSRDLSMPSGIFRVSRGSGAGYLYTWMDFIFPYVKSTQLFICPSFSVKHSGNQEGSPSYGYNVHINRVKTPDGNGGLGGNSSPPLAVAAIGRASEIVLSLDFPVLYSLTAGPETYCNTDTSSNGFMNPANSRYDLVWPHMEGGVVTFADGHAKWYKRGSSSICRVTSTNAGLNQRAWDPTLP